MRLAFMYLTRVSDSSNPSSRRTEVVVGAATAMIMVRLFSHWSEPDTGGITARVILTCYI